MAAATNLATSSGDDDVDRNLALLAYGLLFFAVFFAGVPSLVAVAIAYAKRRHTTPLIASHHRFQIFIFWVGFGLTVVAAALALASIGWMLAEVIVTAIHSRWEGWTTVAALPPFRIGPTTVAFGSAALTFGLLAGLWLLVTSAYGFIRLASQHSIRQTAR